MGWETGNRKSVDRRKEARKSPDVKCEAINQGELSSRRKDRMADRQFSLSEGGTDANTTEERKVWWQLRGDIHVWSSFLSVSM